MAKLNQLSLWDAILININVMFGTGVLINTVNVAKRAGSLGFFSYLIVSIIMLPLIFSIAAIVQRHPAGGFYTYAAVDIAPWAGFLSAWTYFVAKLSSAALLIHIFSTVLKTIIVPLNSVSTLIIDLVILLFFLWLNQFNLRTGTRITYVFIILKITPIIFAILSCIYLFSRWSIPPETLLWSGIPSTIPLVLYAFVGFEAACSLSSTIKDARHNAPKAILYSYALVILITIIYQLTIFIAIGTSLMKQQTFLDIFPTLFTTLFAQKTVFHTHLLYLLYIASASSALGASYGILLSNAWNLHILAQNTYVFGSSFLKKLNTYNVPFACVIVETIICAGYLLLTYGNQIALQQISVFGCTIAYSLSVISLLHHSYKNLIAWLALGSCCLLLGTCIHNFINSETYYLFLFLGIIMFGMIMFYLKKQK